MKSISTRTTAKIPDPDDDRRSDTDVLEDVVAATGAASKLLRKIRNPWVIGGVGGLSAPLSSALTEMAGVQLPSYVGWMVGPIMVTIIALVDYWHVSAKRQISQAVDIKGIKKLLQDGNQLHRAMIEDDKRRDQEFIDHLRDHHNFTQDEYDAWQENRERDEQEAVRKKHRASKGNMAIFRPKTENAVRPPEKFDEGEDPPTLRPQNRRR